jgi:lipopolysaccharide transport system ATP-binding protein
VQTAVEPNLLIIDEAISVGDVFFQARCMARIRSLIDSGVTVLFVSHDTGSVRQLCSRALLLEGGRVRADGPASEVADQYFRRELEDRNEASRRALRVRRQYRRTGA